jgi:hypothetical protein
MNVSAVINGSVVTVVEVIGNGSCVFVSYIDGSQNLKVDRLFLSGSGTIIGTSAVAS